MAKRPRSTPRKVPARKSRARSAPVSASPLREFSRTWADHWRVTLRTVQRWRLAALRRAMPSPDDVPAMLRWELTPGAKPPAFRRRCAELRLAQARALADPTLPAPTSPPPSSESNHAELQADWVEFQRQHPTHTSKAQAAQIQTLERELEFATFALGRARDRGDDYAQKKFSDDVIKFSRAVKEQKLLADRLGLESGELIPRATCETYLRAHAYWTMRATDLALDALAARLINLSFPEEARTILEAELLSVRFVQAYAHATRVAARNALPPWAVHCIRDTVDDFIEHGAALFDSALVQPEPDDHLDGSGI